VNVLLMYQPSPEHAAALQAAAPNARLLIAHDEPSAAQLIADAEVVLGNRYFLQSLPHARALRWMQSNSMGLDLVLSAGAQLHGLTITCARGVYDDIVAEHALALLLGVVRGLHTARDAQRERRWQRTPLGRLTGTHALVLGWGGVGRAIARRLLAFGMHVTAARRRPGADLAPGLENVTVCGPEAWQALLPTTDALLLALPLTPETRYLVNADVLRALPRSACVVNVGRGATVDEAALLAALDRGELAGAGLDVLEQEPPAADSPVWTCDRLLLTPHVARPVESPPFAWEPLFVENLRRYAHGEPLLHLVDNQAGY